MIQTKYYFSGSDSRVWNLCMAFLKPWRTTFLHPDIILLKRIRGEQCHGAGHRADWRYINPFFFFFFLWTGFFLFAKFPPQEPICCFSQNKSSRKDMELLTDEWCVLLELPHYWNDEILKIEFQVGEWGNIEGQGILTVNALASL